MVVHNAQARPIRGRLVLFFHGGSTVSKVKRIRVEPEAKTGRVASEAPAIMQGPARLSTAKQCGFCKHYYLRPCTDKTTPPAPIGGISKSVERNRSCLI